MEQQNYDRAMDVALTLAIAIIAGLTLWEQIQRGQFPLQEMAAAADDTAAFSILTTKTKSCEPQKRQKERSIYGIF